MSRTKREIVAYTCDVCGKDIEKNDGLAIIGKNVPVLIESGNKERWGTLKVDLCSDCAKKFIKLRVTATYLTAIKDDMNEWVDGEDKDV